METILFTIRKAFHDAANPAHAAPMAAYMKGIAPFFGVKTPERRLISKEIFAAYPAFSSAEFDAIARLLFAQPERELHYLAIDWLHYRCKSFTPDTIGLIHDLLTTKSWWDSVDSLATRSLGFWTRQFPAEAEPVIRSFIESNNFWLARAAIIHTLHHGGNTNTSRLSAAILPHTKSKEFFLQKAIGWALRQYARTDPEWVREFVATYPLAALSKREALKHL